MKGIAFLIAATMPVFTEARQGPGQPWNLHFQATYIYQYKPSFRSAYEGLNSLKAKEEKQNSLTATLYAGLRLWNGASLYVNPELAGGNGLSGALGMGASSNGETFRVGDPAPALYLARAFIQQDFPLGKTTEIVDDDANQLGGTVPVNFLRIRAGKLSLGDVLDNNAYSNSPRSQFMNWALMNNGAWDYAANVRGYTYAFVSSLHLHGYIINAAVAALPETANGAVLSTAFGSSHSLNIELGKVFLLHDRTGNIRLLYYLNKAAMGNYDQSIAVAGAGFPDIASTRVHGRTKHGIGINADLEVGAYAGLFARGGWNDGKNETWCFTEIDRTLTGGVSLDGAAWKRNGDHAGIAVLVNGLSDPHRAYLGKGGYGFIIGDGKLRYAPEYAAELYYSLKPAKSDLWLSGDYQLAFNPGYNKDRGPVNIFCLRLHVEL